MNNAKTKKQKELNPKKFAKKELQTRRFALFLILIFIGSIFSNPYSFVSAQSSDSDKDKAEAETEATTKNPSEYTADDWQKLSPELLAKINSNIIETALTDGKLTITDANYESLKLHLAKIDQSKLDKNNLEKIKPADLDISDFANNIEKSRLLTAEQLSYKKEDDTNSRPNLESIPDLVNVNPTSLMKAIKDAYNVKIDVLITAPNSKIEKGVLVVGSDNTGNPGNCQNKCKFNFNSDIKDNTIMVTTQIAQNGKYSISILSKKEGTSTSVGNCADCKIIALTDQNNNNYISTGKILIKGTGSIVESESDGKKIYTVYINKVKTTIDSFEDTAKVIFNEAGITVIGSAVIKGKYFNKDLVLQNFRGTSSIDYDKNKLIVSAEAAIINYNSVSFNGNINSEFDKNGIMQTYNLNEKNSWVRYKRNDDTFVTVTNKGTSVKGVNNPRGIDNLRKYQDLIIILQKNQELTGDDKLALKQVLGISNEKEINTNNYANLIKNINSKIDIEIKSQRSSGKTWADETIAFFDIDSSGFANKRDAFSGIGELTVTSKPDNTKGNILVSMNGLDDHTTFVLREPLDGGNLKDLVSLTNSKPIVKDFAQVTIKSSIKYPDTDNNQIKEDNRNLEFLFDKTKGITNAKIKRNSLGEIPKDYTIGNGDLRGIAFGSDIVTDKNGKMIPVFFKNDGISMGVLFADNSQGAIIGVRDIQDKINGYSMLISAIGITDKKDSRTIADLDKSIANNQILKAYYDYGAGDKDSAKNILDKIINNPNNNQNNQDANDLNNKLNAYDALAKIYAEEKDNIKASELIKSAGDLILKQYSSDNKIPNDENIKNHLIKLRMQELQYKCGTDTSCMNEYVTKNKLSDNSVYTTASSNLANRIKTKSGQANKIAAINKILNDNKKSVDEKIKAAEKLAEINAIQGNQMLANLYLQKNNANDKNGENNDENNNENLKKAELYNNKLQSLLLGKVEDVGFNMDASGLSFKDFTAYLKSTDMTQANIDYSNKKYDESIKTLSFIIDIDKDNIDARSLRANSYLAKNDKLDLESAKTDLELVAEKATGDAKNNALNTLAQIYQSEGNLQRAIDTIKKTSDKFNSDIKTNLLEFDKSGLAKKTTEHYARINKIKNELDSLNKISNDKKTEEQKIQFNKLTLEKNKLQNQIIINQLDSKIKSNSANKDEIKAYNDAVNRRNTVAIIISLNNAQEKIKSFDSNDKLSYINLQNELETEISQLSTGVSVEILIKKYQPDSLDSYNSITKNANIQLNNIAQEVIKGNNENLNLVKNYKIKLTNGQEMTVQKYLDENKKQIEKQQLPNTDLTNAEKLSQSDNLDDLEKAKKDYLKQNNFVEAIKIQDKIIAKKRTQYHQASIITPDNNQKILNNNEDQGQLLNEYEESISELEKLKKIKEYYQDQQYKNQLLNYDINQLNNEEAKIKKFMEFASDDVKKIYEKQLIQVIATKEFLDTDKDFNKIKALIDKKEENIDTSNKKVGTLDRWFKTEDYKNLEQNQKQFAAVQDLIDDHLNTLDINNLKTELENYKNNYNKEHVFSQIVEKEKQLTVINSKINSLKKELNLNTETLDIIKYQNYAITSETGIKYNQLAQLLNEKNTLDNENNKLNNKLKTLKINDFYVQSLENAIIAKESGGGIVGETEKLLFNLNKIKNNIKDAEKDKDQIRKQILLNQKENLFSQANQLLEINNQAIASTDDQNIKTEIFISSLKIKRDFLKDYKDDMDNQKADYINQNQLNNFINIGVISAWRGASSQIGGLFDVKTGLSEEFEKTIKIDNEILDQITSLNSVINYLDAGKDGNGKYKITINDLQKDITKEQVKKNLDQNAPNAIIDYTFEQLNQAKKNNLIKEETKIVTDEITYVNKDYFEKPLLDDFTSIKATAQTAVVSSAIMAGVSTTGKILTSASGRLASAAETAIVNNNKVSGSIYKGLSKITQAPVNAAEKIATSSLNPYVLNEKVQGLTNAIVSKTIKPIINLKPISGIATSKAGEFTLKTTGNIINHYTFEIGVEEIAMPKMIEGVGGRHASDAFGDLETIMGLRKGRGSIQFQQTIYDGKTYDYVQTYNINDLKKEYEYNGLKTEIIDKGNYIPNAIKVTNPNTEQSFIVAQKDTPFDNNQKTILIDNNNVIKNTETNSYIPIIEIKGDINPALEVLKAENKKKIKIETLSDSHFNGYISNIDGVDKIIIDGELGDQKIKSLSINDEINNNFMYEKPINQIIADDIQKSIERNDALKAEINNKKKSAWDILKSTESSEYFTSKPYKELSTSEKDIIQDIADDITLSMKTNEPGVVIEKLKNYKLLDDNYNPIVKNDIIYDYVKNVKINTIKSKSNLYHNYDNAIKTIENAKQTKDTKTIDDILELNNIENLNEDQKNKLLNNLVDNIKTEQDNLKTQIELLADSPDEEFKNKLIKTKNEYFDNIVEKNLKDTQNQNHNNIQNTENNEENNIQEVQDSNEIKKDNDVNSDNKKIEQDNNGLNEQIDKKNIQTKNSDTENNDKKNQPNSETTSSDSSQTKISDTNNDPPNNAQINSDLTAREILKFNDYYKDINKLDKPTALKYAELLGADVNSGLHISKIKSRLWEKIKETNKQTKPLIETIENLQLEITELDNKIAETKNLITNLKKYNIEPTETVAAELLYTGFNIIDDKNEFITNVKLIIPNIDNSIDLNNVEIINSETIGDLPISYTVKIKSKNQKGIDTDKTYKISTTDIIFNNVDLNEDQLKAVDSITIKEVIDNLATLTGIENKNLKILKSDLEKQNKINELKEIEKEYKNNDKPNSIFNPEKLKNELDNSDISLDDLTAYYNKILDGLEYQQQIHPEITSNEDMINNINSNLKIIENIKTRLDQVKNNNVVSDTINDDDNNNIDVVSDTINDNNPKEIMAENGLKYIIENEKIIRIEFNNKEITNNVVQNNEDIKETEVVSLLDNEFSKICSNCVFNDGNVIPLNLENCKSCSFYKDTLDNSIKLRQTVDNKVYEFKKIIKKDNSIDFGFVNIENENDGNIALDTSQDVSEENNIETNTESIEKKNNNFQTSIDTNIKNNIPDKGIFYSNNEDVVFMGDLHGTLSIKKSDSEEIEYTLFNDLQSQGLIEGDANNPDSWKWVGGKKIFIQVGDIYDRGPDAFIIRNTLNRLADEAKNSGGNVLRVLGNHELGYISPQIVYGIDFNNYHQIRKDILDDIEKGYIKAAISINGNIVTHAGINLNKNVFESWKNKPSEYIAEDINKRLVEAIEKNNFDDPIFDIGKKRGGNADIGGIFWLDQKEGISNLGYIQYIGHTPISRKEYIDTITIDKQKNVINLDVGRAENYGGGSGVFIEKASNNDVNDNNVNNNHFDSNNIENKIQSAQSIDDLKRIVTELKTIPTSNGKFSSEDINNLIEQVLNGDKDINYITSRNGLRNKVTDFLIESTLYDFNDYMSNYYKGKIDSNSKNRVMNKIKKLQNTKITKNENTPLIENMNTLFTILENDNNGKYKNKEKLYTDLKNIRKKLQYPYFSDKNYYFYVSTQNDKATVKTGKVQKQTTYRYNNNEFKVKFVDAIVSGIGTKLYDFNTLGHETSTGETIVFTENLPIANNLDVVLDSIEIHEIQHKINALKNTNFKDIAKKQSNSQNEPIVYNEMSSFLASLIIGKDTVRELTDITVRANDQSNKEHDIASLIIVNELSKSLKIKGDLDTKKSKLLNIAKNNPGQIKDVADIIHKNIIGYSIIDDRKNLEKLGSFDNVIRLNKNNDPQVQAAYGTDLGGILGIRETLDQIKQSSAESTLAQKSLQTQKDFAINNIESIKTQTSNFNKAWLDTFTTDQKITDNVIIRPVSGAILSGAKAISEDSQWIIEIDKARLLEMIGSLPKNLQNIALQSVIAHELMEIKYYDSIGKPISKLGEVDQNLHSRLAHITAVYGEKILNSNLNSDEKNQLSQALKELNSNAVISYDYELNNQLNDKFDKIINKIKLNSRYAGLNDIDLLHELTQKSNNIYINYLTLSSIFNNDPESLAITMAAIKDADITQTETLNPPILVKSFFDESEFNQISDKLPSIYAADYINSNGDGLYDILDDYVDNKKVENNKNDNNIENNVDENNINNEDLIPIILQIEINYIELKNINIINFLDSIKDYSGVVQRNLINQRQLTIDDLNNLKKDLIVNNYNIGLINNNNNLIDDNNLNTDNNIDNNVNNNIANDDYDQVLSDINLIDKIINNVEFENANDLITITNNENAVVQNLVEGKPVRLYHKLRSYNDFEAIKTDGFKGNEFYKDENNNYNTYFSLLPPSTVSENDYYVYIDLNKETTDNKKFFDYRNVLQTKKPTYNDLIKQGYAGYISNSISDIANNGMEVVIFDGESLKGLAEIYETEQNINQEDILVNKIINEFSAQDKSIILSKDNLKILLDKIKDFDDNNLNILANKLKINQKDLKNLDLSNLNIENLITLNKLYNMLFDDQKKSINLRSTSANFNYNTYLYAHGTNAFTLLQSTLYTNLQLRPSNDLLLNPLTGESAGKTNLNKNYVSTISLICINCRPDSAIDYSKASSNQFILTPKEVDKQIEYLKNADWDQSANLFFDSKDELLNSLEQNKKYLYWLIQNKLYDQYLELSSIPIVIIGDSSGEMKNVHSSISNEVAFDRLNTRLIATDSVDNVQKITKLLNQQGIMNVHVIRFDELETLSEDYREHAFSNEQNNMIDLINDDYNNDYNKMDLNDNNNNEVKNYNFKNNEISNNDNDIDQLITSIYLSDKDQALLNSELNKKGLTYDKFKSAIINNNKEFLNGLPKYNELEWIIDSYQNNKNNPTELERIISQVEVFNKYAKLKTLDNTDPTIYYESAQNLLMQNPDTPIDFATINIGIATANKVGGQAFGTSVKDWVLARAREITKDNYPTFDVSGSFLQTRVLTIMTEEQAKQLVAEFEEYRDNELISIFKQSNSIKNVDTLNNAIESLKQMRLDIGLYPTKFSDMAEYNNIDNIVNEEFEKSKNAIPSENINADKSDLKNKLLSKYALDYAIQSSNIALGTAQLSEISENKYGSQFTTISKVGDTIITGKDSNDIIDVENINAKDAYELGKIKASSQGIYAPESMSHGEIPRLNHDLGLTLEKILNNEYSQDNLEQFMIDSLKKPDNNKVYRREHINEVNKLMQEGIIKDNVAMITQGDEIYILYRDGSVIKDLFMELNWFNSFNEKFPFDNQDSLYNRILNRMSNHISKGLSDNRPIKDILSEINYVIADTNIEDLGYRNSITNIKYKTVGEMDWQPTEKDSASKRNLIWFNKEGKILLTNDVAEAERYGYNFPFIFTPTDKFTSISIDNKNIDVDMDLNVRFNNLGKINDVDKANDKKEIINQIYISKKIKPINWDKVIKPAGSKAPRTVEIKDIIVNYDAVKNMDLDQQIEKFNQENLYFTNQNLENANDNEETNSNIIPAPVENSGFGKLLQNTKKTIIGTVIITSIFNPIVSDFLNFGAKIFNIDLSAGDHAYGKSSIQETITSENNINDILNILSSAEKELINQKIKDLEKIIGNKIELVITDQDNYHKVIRSQSTNSDRFIFVLDTNGNFYLFNDNRKPNSLLIDTIEIEAFKNNEKSKDSIRLINSFSNLLTIYSNLNNLDDNGFNELKNAALNGDKNAINKITTIILLNSKYSESGISILIELLKNNNEDAINSLIKIAANNNLGDDNNNNKNSELALQKIKEYYDQLNNEIKSNVNNKNLENNANNNLGDNGINNQIDNNRGVEDQNSANYKLRDLKNKIYDIFKYNPNLYNDNYEDIIYVDLEQNIASYYGLIELHKNFIINNPKYADKSYEYLKNELGKRDAILESDLIRMHILSSFAEIIFEKQEYSDEITHILIKYEDSRFGMNQALYNIRNKLIQNPNIYLSIQSTEFKDLIHQILAFRLDTLHYQDQTNTQLRKELDKYPIELIYGITSNGVEGFVITFKELHRALKQRIFHPNNDYTYKIDDPKDDQNLWKEFLKLDPNQEFLGSILYAYNAKGHFNKIIPTNTEGKVSIVNTAINEITKVEDINELKNKGALLASPFNLLINDINTQDYTKEAIIKTYRNNINKPEIKVYFESIIFQDIDIYQNKLDNSEIDSIVNSNNYKIYDLIPESINNQNQKIFVMFSQSQKGYLTRMIDYYTFKTDGSQSKSDALWTGYGYTDYPHDLSIGGFKIDPEKTTTGIINGKTADNQIGEDNNKVEITLIKQLDNGKTIEFMLSNDFTKLETSVQDKTFSGFVFAGHSFENTGFKNILRSNLLNQNRDIIIYDGSCGSAKNLPNMLINDQINLIGNLQTGIGQNNQIQIYYLADLLATGKFSTWSELKDQLQKHTSYTENLLYPGDTTSQVYKNIINNLKKQGYIFKENGDLIIQNN